MHAPPPHACLLRLLLTTATFSPSKHHHQTWRWRTWSPFDTAASRRLSRAACVTVQAPFIAFSMWHDHNPLQFACSGKVPVLRAVSLSMCIALGKKVAVNVFYAARLRRSLSNDVPEHLFFLFFFRFRNSLIPDITSYAQS